MFSFGARSLANLHNVHPKLVACVMEAISDSTQDFMVFEGVRTIEKEEENIKSGASKLTDPKDCKHCIQKSGYGHAVDLVPVVDGKPVWDWKLVIPVVHAMQIAETKRSITIRWGGVWDKTLNTLSDDLLKETSAYVQRHHGPDFLDGVHFEIILQNNAPNDEAKPDIIA